MSDLRWEDLTDDERKAALERVQLVRLAAEYDKRRAAEHEAALRVMGPSERWFRSNEPHFCPLVAGTFGFSDGIKGRERFRGPWPKRVPSFVRESYRMGFDAGRRSRFR